MRPGTVLGWPGKVRTELEEKRGKRKIGGQKKKKGHNRYVEVTMDGRKGMVTELLGVRRRIFASVCANRGRVGLRGLCEDIEVDRVITGGKHGSQ